MTAITLNSRVRLKDPAQYRDIGTRTGIVVRIDGWPVVHFDKIPGEVRISPDELEVANG